MLRTSPSVSPLIYVGRSHVHSQQLIFLSAHATYGLSENTIKERLNEVNKMLHLIDIYVQK
jgi:hypothetical protein